MRHLKRHIKIISGRKGDMEMSFKVDITEGNIWELKEAKFQIKQHTSG